MRGEDFDGDKAKRIKMTSRGIRSGMVHVNRVEGEVYGLLALDVDDHLTRSGRFASEVYMPHMRGFAERGVLPWELIEQPHIDFAHRREVKDIAFLFETGAAVLEARGATYPLSPEELIEQVIKPYQSDLVRLEAQMQLYKGVKRTLKSIRRRWPKVFILAHTDCPDWLALLRLHLAGILEYFDGLVAVAPLKPDLGNSRFAACLPFSEAWLQQVEASVPHAHLQFRASMPQRFAKPSIYGLRSVMAALKVPEGSVVSAGNNRFKEGLVAARASTGPIGRQGGVRFVLVQHPGESDGEPPAGFDPRQVRIDRTVNSIPALLPYLQGVFGRKH